MGHLHLSLLGTPEVRHAGRLLKFRTRKELALLVYLTVEGGKHSREKITALFWPDSDEPQGRATLRRTLTDLRDTLEDVSAHLLIERDFLSFQAQGDTELDLALVERASNLASSELQPALNTAELLRALEQAARLYRGHFLEGFSSGDTPDFEDWTRLQREIWYRRAEDIFDRLSRLQFENRAFARAIETTLHWIAQDALNEAPQRRLMQSYAAAGDRNAALRAYENYRLRLAEELHAKPAEETEALAMSIRAQVAASAVTFESREGAYTRQAPSMISGARKRGELATPLVGRTNEYTRLIECYQRAQSGHAQVVMLKGEAGIGKTRLAGEFLAWAAAQGAEVLPGRAFEAGGRLPYQPLVEALRGRIERENSPDDLLSDVWLAELARLLPELRERYPDLSVPAGDEATARIRLYEAIVRLGQAFAERATLVLFIDDVQWADAASLDVLHYAGRRWMESGTPILILLTTRVESISTIPGLSRWIGNLERDLKLTSITLEALHPHDLLQLVQALSSGNGHVGGNATEEFSRWLFSETRGQPFYALETLKALLERGLLASQVQADGRLLIHFEEAWRDQVRLHSFLPPGVREVIRTRLDPLSAPAFSLLAACAVIGRRSTFERLYQVGGLSESEGLSALEEVITNQLLREIAAEADEQAPMHPFEAGGTYFFTHDKIRDVVYSEMGEARRRVFHRRALELLQGDATPAAELAHHALSAGLREEAYSLCIAAGDDALRLFATRDAIIHYEKARQIVRSQQVPPSSLPGRLIPHLYVQLGRAYELSNEWEAARTLYQEMLDRAQSSQLPAMECLALNRLGMLLIHERYALDQADRLLRQALQVAERINERESLAETAWNLAQLKFYQFDYHQLIAYGERALQVAREVGQPELIARCLNVTALGKKDTGCWQEAGGLAEEAVLLYQKLGNRAMEVDSLCMVASVNINTSFPEEGIRLAQRAWKISQEISNAWGQANSGYHLAAGLLDRGFYDEALAYAQQAVSVARINKVLPMQGNCLTLLGTVYRARLALKEACQAHIEARTIYEEMHSQPLANMASAELCADYALAGLWEEAYEAALYALAVPDYCIQLSSRRATWYQTEALLRAGQHELAARDVEYYGRLVGESRRYRIPYLRALAVLALQIQKIEQAISGLQEAAQLAREIGLPGEEHSIQVTLGEIYRQQGEVRLEQHAFALAAELAFSLASSIVDEQERIHFLLNAKTSRLFRPGM
jgi:predicted ATPase/DNA-binding SARP family transcriptional activator